ncbi:hypothetical protein ACFCWT_23530, partial [Streptomyces olivaceus]|uniref:hypothetical protein n=1 Tax=Streptomyces olivaceus TaxID=47716 RepID=UPI0035D6093B
PVGGWREAGPTAGGRRRAAGGGRRAAGGGRRAAGGGEFLSGRSGEILHAPFGRVAPPDLDVFRHVKRSTRDDNSLTSGDAGFRH